MSKELNEHKEMIIASAAKVSGESVVSPSICWVSIRRVFTKAAGIALFIGWSKYPCTIMITIGEWTLTLGPHIYSKERRYNVNHIKDKTMRDIVFTINCPNCDTKIKLRIINVTDNNEVDVSLFEQTEWDCPRCKKTFVIGDIDISDSSDVMCNDLWKHRGKKMACVTCRWFVATAKRDDFPSTAPIGMCRRHAPAVSGYRYPVVFENDWCGDYELDENAA